jgi:hypothetical protein
LNNITSSDSLREKIIEALRSHPEGLTLKDIAEIVGSHRHTITKYVYELIGAQVIIQRDVGAAKLCYLKESFKGEEGKKRLERFSNNRKGQVQIAVLLIALLLVPTTIIVAQNVTNSTSGLEGMLTGINNSGAELDIPDFLLSDEPGTGLPENGTNTAPDDTPINITEINSTGNFTNTTAPDEQDENKTDDINVTPEIPGEMNDTNATPESEANVTPVIVPEINDTVGENETEENDSVSDIIPDEPEEPPEVTDPESGLEPELKLDIVSPGKVTRGHEIELKAVLENLGIDSSEVVLEWILPDYFEIVTGNEIDEVGLLPGNSTFTSEITVFSNRDAVLGETEIRVRVSYV